MSCRVRSQSTVSTITGKTRPPTRTRLRAHRGTVSGSLAGPRRGLMPNRRRTPTSTITNAEMANMNHHRPAMRTAPGPLGLTVEGAPLLQALNVRVATSPAASTPNRDREPSLGTFTHYPPAHLENGDFGQRRGAPRPLTRADLTLQGPGQKLWGRVVDRGRSWSSTSW